MTLFFVYTIFTCTKDGKKERKRNVKYTKKSLIKQDINFLENPMWLVDDKVIAKEYRINKSNGTYKIKGPEGLPNKFDSVVLYYLLGELLKKGSLENREMVTTRYQIAKSVFHATQSVGKSEYDRIMKSLRKWHGLTIEFNGTFYEDKEHTSRLFHIIDGVILNKKRQTLAIHFNEQYLQLLRNTRFCKYFDFDEYKKITGSVSARLYEILIKSFKERPTWHIDIRNLAEKITLEKRPLAKDYYPSDVLIKLKPAIREINEKTDFFINFEYDKETSLCTFKLTNQEKFKALAKIDNDLQQEADTIIPAYKEPKDDALVRVLIAWDMPSDKAHELLKTYGVEKVKHKLEFLQNNQAGIKKPMGWLIKALEQDWNSHAYNKQLEEQKLKKEIARKRAEEDAHKKLLAKLKQEHVSYLENKALDLYKLLPPKIAKVYDLQFIDWVKQEKLKTRGIAAPDHVYRIQYLKEILLEESDCDFDAWVAIKRTNVL